MRREITKEEIALLRFAVRGAFGKIVDEIPENVDLTKVMAEAKHQSVVSSAYEGAYLMGVELPSELDMKYLRATASIAASNEKLMMLQSEAIELLQKNEIAYSVIKGASVSVMYNDPAMRTMGDVDIIVSKKDYERAQGIFSENFEVIGEDGRIHSEYCKNGKIIELHKSMNGLPKNEIGGELEGIFDEITENSIKCTLDGYDFMCPNAETTGIILLLHTYEHLTTGGIGLRHLFDFAAYAEKYLSEKNNRDGYQRLLLVFEKYGMLKFAKNLMDCICSISGFERNDYPWISDFSSKGSMELLIDILDGGNFGKKKPDERYISEIIVKDDGKKNNIFKRMFRNFIEVAKSSMPSVNKYPILYPIAFVYIPIRYLFRVITGKRSAVNPVKMVKSSVERHGIYENFDMFKR